MPSAAGPEGWHLAQLNVARMRAPIDSPVMREFNESIPSVNELAERSPGFVWRLVGDGGDATDVQAFDDPLLLVNMSVWESVEALRAFAYRTGHLAYYRRRAEWFLPLDEAHMVLWWVPAGHRPTVEEGKERLARLRAEGPTPGAFTFAQGFPPPLRA